MTVRAPTYDILCEPPHRRTLAWRKFVRFAWHLVRLPTLAVLLALEPFASLILTAAGLLGMLTALILRCSNDLPHFPFWQMMGLSTGALLLRTVYHGLISILSR